MTYFGFKFVKHHVINSCNILLNKCLYSMLEGELLSVRTTAEKWLHFAGILEY